MSVVVKLVIRNSNRFYATTVRKAGLNSAGFPGAKTTTLCDQLKFSKSLNGPIPTFSILGPDHLQPNLSKNNVPKDVVLGMYRTMMKLNMMDKFLYEAVHRNDISMYITAEGEEAIVVASAMALHEDDMIFAQYRESGALLARGMDLKYFMDLGRHNKSAFCNGVNLSVLCSSRNYFYFSTSAPLGTQVSQAVGYAYASKLSYPNSRTTAMCYFGEGAAVCGDISGSLNFAAVLDVPVIFFCRNNGFAISSPSEEQYRGDGVVAKGMAAGIHSTRVDGNDALAVWQSVQEAREFAMTHCKPVLIEAMTYRIGSHNSIAEQCEFRSQAEVEGRREEKNPIFRLRNYLTQKGYWTDEEEVDLEAKLMQEIHASWQAAIKEKRASIFRMFDNVYEGMDKNGLSKQKDELCNHLIEYAKMYAPHISIHEGH